MNTEKAKTENGKLPIFSVSHSALRNLIEEFRIWNCEWEKYDNKESTKKPKSVDDFMNEINEKYVVGYTHCS